MQASCGLVLACAASIVIFSYDEKPGIQAIATTAPDLPPEPGVHETFARDHEYERKGTVSLLAGIDLLTGQVHALVRDRHRSCEFIEFLQLVDARLSAPHGDQADPRQSFSPHFQADQGLARQTAGWPLRIHPRQNTAPGSISSRVSSRNSPDRCCAISVSQRSKSSRIASWPPWLNSTAIQSSTPGPISSTKSPDMIRTSKSLN